MVDGLIGGVRIGACRQVHRDDDFRGRIGSSRTTSEVSETGQLRCVYVRPSASYRSREDEGRGGETCALYESEQGGTWTVENANVK